jgi:phage baseplate assembly protein W
MHLDHPFHFDTRGRSSETSDDDYLRQLIELTLFTSPGERVHRPTFGSGLMQLLFASNSDAVAAATQVAVQGALQQWLGDLIEAQAVVIQSDDNQLQIEIRYLVRRNQRQQTATFTRSL